MTPPQTNIPVAANVLATLGTVFWCVQLVPQIWYNWKRKKTEGLPGMMMLLWAICSIPFGVYAIVQQFAIGIQVQPQVFGVLALVNWGQTLLYHDGWSRRNSTLAVLACTALFGGIEVLLIFTLRIPYRNGVGWPILFIGIVAAVLLAAGLIPPYLELWKRHGRVIGINWVFLTIDWLGAFFSLLAVVEQQTFDALGGSLYIIVMALEAGIFVSHWIWLLRKRYWEVTDEERVLGMTKQGGNTNAGQSDVEHGVPAKEPHKDKGERTPANPIGDEDKDSGTEEKPEAVGIGMPRSDNAGNARRPEVFMTEKTTHDNCDKAKQLEGNGIST